MWLFIGRQPLLNSYQGSLPSLPVPALKDTMKRVHFLKLFCHVHNSVLFEIAFAICIFKISVVLDNEMLSQLLRHGPPGLDIL